MSSVTVLGAGPWGVTLAWLLAGNGHDVSLWSTDPARRELLRRTRRLENQAPIELPPTVQVCDALEGALKSDLLFVALRPTELRGAIRDLSPWLRPDHRAVHVARGLDEGGFLSATFAAESCVIRVGALAGPLVVESLWRGEEGAAVVGSPFAALCEEVMVNLSGPKLRIYGTDDLPGVEVGGALRVPWAVAMGLVGAAGAGRSLWTVLLTRALAEGGRLATAMGGRAETLAGLGGLGDWLASSLDAEDPLVVAGGRLARTGRLAHPEAERRIRTLVRIAAARRVEMPILSAIAAVLDGQALREAMGTLMARPPRLERG